ncbi:hypothetical protein LTR16_004939 [Cryomyces antarcticus]|uniref:Myb-like domain-containing protein n=1 Tax=Cryomyces antarcticus TaxID=329879 RepID=A0ABR0KRG5_9PEZI|nr:hypothetical protein LTR60_006430 [Cryomyces antarcticus]KAK5118155.1 hypothetical protein LTR16_004939 [Cryomyces antarcticus]
MPTNQNSYLQAQSNQNQIFRQMAARHVLPSQVTRPEPYHSIHQQHVLRHQILPSHHQLPSSHYSPAQQHLGYHHPSPLTRKRSRQDDLQLDMQGLQELQNEAAEPVMDVPLELTPQGHHAQPQHGALPTVYQTHPQHQPQQQQHHQHQVQPTQTHHHHRLPNQPPPSKMQRHEFQSDSASPPAGPSTVVGQEGMPPPALRPRGPKLKFTPEDDQLLIDLKEKKNLTWKQIADFFPGRSSGTLQVRYCTKLKAKVTAWTDDMVQKLKTAMQDYDTDRWRIISGKVGSGFSPAACKEKAEELEAEAAIEANALDEPQASSSHNHIFQ